MKISGCTPLTSFLALIIISMVSCKKEPETVVEERYENGNPRIEKVYTIKGDQKILVSEVHYYKNRAKKAEGHYTNNLRDKKWTAWFENGNINTEAMYKNGALHGEYTVYHPNGNIFYSGLYKHGNRVGLWKFRNKDGAFVKSVNYDKE